MDSNADESRKINKMFENKLEKKEKIGDWRNRIQRRTQMIMACATTTAANVGGFFNKNQTRKLSR